MLALKRAAHPRFGEYSCIVEEQEVESEAAEFSLVKKLIDESDRLAGVPDPTAPVVLPSRADVRVQLVSLDKLRILDDARSDSGTHLALTLLFAGAVLGFVVNVVTGGSVPEPLAWVFLGVLCLVVAIFWRLHRRAEARAQAVRSEIFQGPT